ncbi:MAG: SDR family oxidoreductase [Woeseia sp.]
METQFELSDKTAVVTGGGAGIGRAICRAFAGEGARIVVVDINATTAKAVADEIGGVALTSDVSTDAGIAKIVGAARSAFGSIDIFISNAGVGFGDGADGAALAPMKNWEACLAINLMAHVYAARHVIPGMLERGGGCLVNVVSAAGLLSQIGDIAYTTSKHAALGFAESLAISYGDRGIRVSVVCPQAVATRMIGFDEDAGGEPAGIGGNDLDGILTPEEVAEDVIEGVRQGRFMILPHPRVATYFQRKANDHDRWIRGMQRFRQRLN